MHPIREYYMPISVHSLWAGGGELREKYSRVGTIVGEASLSCWVCVTISDTTVAGREQERDTASTKSGKASTNTGSMTVRNCLW